MRLKKVHLQNFLSYGNLDFSFHTDPEDEPNIFIISGVNNDSSASNDNSNGSGKSTLVGEAVTFNLFGKNLRGSSKKIKVENTMKFGSEMMVNEAEYYVDYKTVLKIRREKEREGKASLTISVDGEKKSKRLKRLSETDIRDFLGVDPEVYYQTVSYYKDNLSLLAMNYSQRLDFFKKLVDLSIIDTYYQFCKKYKTTTEGKLVEARAKKKAQYDILEAISSNDTKYQQIIQDAIDRLTMEISDLESVEEKSTAPYEEKVKAAEEVQEKIDTEIASLKNQNRIDAVKVKELQQDIKNFSKLRNTSCPTCGQDVTGEYADGIISAKKELLDSLTRGISEREALIEQYSEKSLKLAGKLEKIRKEIEKIKSENTIKKVKLQSLRKQLAEKNEELESVRKALHTEEETNEYRQKIAKLEKAEEILIRRLEINNFWLENLATKSPVRSAIIRKHVNFLSDIFEYYLGKLFRNTIIGKMEIDDEGMIDIILQSDGNEVNYWNLSSGEKKRADLAMLFALYVYILNMTPNAPRFLVLDECFDSLDHDGKGCVTETIADIYNNYHIDIFIISHVEFPTIVFENIPTRHILVTKKDGDSTAEYFENVPERKD